MALHELIVLISYFSYSCLCNLHEGYSLKILPNRVVLAQPAPWAGLICQAS